MNEPDVVIMSTGTHSWVILDGRFNLMMLIFFGVETALAFDETTGEVVEIQITPCAESVIWN